MAQYFQGLENLDRKHGMLVITPSSSWFCVFYQIAFKNEIILKKVFKNLFLALGKNIRFSEKRQKVLNFDNA